VKSLSRSVLIVMTVVFCTCVVSNSFAAGADSGQVSQYALGDQILTINAGLFVPLFLLPTGTWLLAPSESGGPPHLSLGGVGSFSWAAYVSPQIRVGAELGGTFTFSPNSNALLMLPILAKASYVFTVYPFEIPVSFAVGMNIIKYVDQTTIDLLLRPGASFYWIFNSSWSFGLNLNYWFDMQFAADPVNSRTGNFLEVSLGALYHY
jgi:hypothetical protein